METDDMFLQFEEDLDNIAGGSSSVGDNTVSSSQQTTPTPRRRAQSRLFELECHVAINGRIPMTIAPGAEKPISPHAYCLQPVRKTFPVRCLKWADVGREYIEVVKGDLQRLFVLDFNDQAMNRFVEHQMLTTFKEFRADCHRHFKKYSDPEEARANPPNALEQSRTNKAARQKQPYNHSSGSKSFLQRQYELAERKGQPVDRVELFRETHVRAGTFVSQAAEDAHNQMLELQSQPTLEGSQPLSENEICDQVLGRRLGYSKGLGWGPKPRPAERQVQAIRRHLVRSPHKKRLNYKLNFMKLWNELKDHHMIPSSAVRFPDAGRCVGIDGVGNKVFPTHLPASGKPFPTPYQLGVEKASRDAFLPTFFPTLFCTSGNPFATYFSFSSTYLCVGSTPVSCNGCEPLRIVSLDLLRAALHRWPNKPPISGIRPSG
ncbi:CACTA en-spm transposon protein [Cucumis melo var. makuwa]|uniref:CACTA en-spm transposon protein n=1 Tax=Cucumis melo var. makuwa TaxID=1194695 RepID=A0A5D3CQY3_CUCMM|nr:CACTA en-spm transposon protein [Cucumis melo var. makuwa]